MAAPNSRNGPFSNGGEVASRYGNILQTLTVVGVAVGGFYAAVLVPLQNQIVDNRNNIVALREHEGAVNDRVVDKMLEKLKEFLTKDEHQEFRFRIDKQFDGFREQLTAAKNEVSYLRDNLVTRNENVTHWDQNKIDTAELRQQIDTLRKDFGGQYTVAEKIKDLQMQLDEMRRGASTSHIQLMPSGGGGITPTPPPRP